MPKKGRVAQHLLERCRRMREKTAEKRKTEDEMRDASMRQSADPAPPPVLPAGQPPDTPAGPSTATVEASPPLSSAKKRKRLFVSDEADETVVDKHDYNILLPKSVLENIISKSVCGKCYSKPECSFGVRGVGTDSRMIITCSCEEDFCCISDELGHLRQGKKKYYSATMKTVYTCMLEGTSFMA